MLRLTSEAFEDGGEMPARYTCDDENLSPPLAWSGAPEGTRSFALIVDDPDAPDPKAPKMVFVHWLAWNLPGDATGLAEGATGGAMPREAREGTNDGRTEGWTGPCPPVGRHRYFHRLLALDTTLDLHHGARRAELERAMEGHVLETAVLMGTYER